VNSQQTSEATSSIPRIMQNYGELQQLQYNYTFFNCLITSRSKSLLINSSVALTLEAIPPKLNIVNQEEALREEVITQLIRKNIELQLRFNYIVWDQNPQFPNHKVLA
jgi:hypothetical protein